MKKNAFRLPGMETPASSDEPKKPGRPKGGRVYYLEDFTGLWVYISAEDDAVLLTPYPFTRPADKDRIKAIIGAFSA